MYNIFSWKGDKMQILGLILTIIVYIMLIACVILLGIAIFQKKYNFAFFISKILFLYAFIALAVESWALIIIAEGFSIYFNIGFDYSYTLIPILPIAGFIIFSGIMIKRKVVIDNAIEQIAEFLLPAMTIIGFGASTIILFFNINYFSLMI